MNSIKKFLSGNGGVALIPIALVLFSFVFIIGADRTDDGSTSLWGIAGLTLAVIMVVFGLLSILLRLGGSDYESAELAGKMALDTLAARSLLERWLRRSRYYRFVGGILGFLIAIPFMTGDLADITFAILAGITAGGALAEIHVLKRPAASTAVAGLDVRRVRDYVNGTDMAAIATITCGAIAILVAKLLGYGIDGSMRWATITLVVLAAVVVLQFLVVTRSRPALSSDIKKADDLLRFLAATQGFARPAIALSFFMLANATADAESALPLSYSALGLVLLGFMWWYRGRHSRITKLAHQALAS